MIFVTSRIGLRNVNHVSVYRNLYGLNSLLHMQINKTELGYVYKTNEPVWRRGIAKTYNTALKRTKQRNLKASKLCEATVKSEGPARTERREQ